MHIQCRWQICKWRQAWSSCDWPSHIMWCEFIFSLYFYFFKCLFFVLQKRFLSWFNICVCKARLAGQQLHAML